MVMRLLTATTSQEEYEDWAPKLEPMRPLIEPVGNAETEAQLLSMAEATVPDVIIANTKLLNPQTLSIVLQRWKRSGCHVILVSCTRDYDEAVTALRCGVFDLLPAPVDGPRLQQDLRSIQELRNFLLPGISSFDQKKVLGKLLVSYARRVPADQQLNEREINNLYGTQFRSGAFRYVTVCFDSPDPAAGPDPAEWLSLCQAMMLEATAPHCYESVMDCDAIRYRILLNYDRASDGKILELLQQCLNTVQARLPQNAVITFCCSRMHESIVEIISMLDESGDAIWERLQNKTGILLIDAPHPPCPKELQQMFESAEQRLKGACAILDVDRFRTELTAISLLPYRYKCRHEVRSILRSTELYMFTINRDLIASFTDVERTRWDLVFRLRQVTSVEVYIQVYSEMMLSLFQRILANSSGQQSRPVRQAQQFIRQNYASPLSLEAVAGQVGLSPVYFSAVFKKETGTGFSDFLNQCRIEQAKKLLAETGLKVLAVSEAVGFSGPRYFSRVFKNHVGVRPSEYRIAMQRSDAPNP